MCCCCILCVSVFAAPILAPEGVKVVPVQQQKQLDIQWHQQKCSNDYPVHVIGYRINVCETHRCHGMEMLLFLVSSNSAPFSSVTLYILF